MLDKERCMENRMLKEQGKSEREISRLTGHSRHTVRRQFEPILTHPCTDSQVCGIYQNYLWMNKLPY